MPLYRIKKSDQAMQPTFQQELFLFSDGSVNPKTKVGYGAWLLIPAPQVSTEGLAAQVNVRRFAPTSSTQLELQTLLLALSGIESPCGKIRIYTDSQTIIGLPQRRERLQQNDYCARSGRRLNHAALYGEFYRLLDRFDCEFVKLAGHLPAGQKTEIDRLFSLVDKASRQALREETG